MLPAWLATVIILVVTVVWLVNFAAGLLIPGYANNEINLAFLSLVGGALALKKPGKVSP